MPSTVGQFTGQVDNNKEEAKKIYERNKIEARINSQSEEYIVFWNEDKAGFWARSLSDPGQLFPLDIELISKFNVKVCKEITEKAAV